MRFRCQIGESEPVTRVLYEVPPAAAVALPRAAPRASRGASWPLHSAVAGAVILVAAGCASRGSTAITQWKVEPVFDVKHAGQSSESYVTLGQYHEGAGALAKAIDAYGKAVSVDAKNPDAHNALGIALAKTGRYAEAEASLRTAVALAPTRSHMRNNLGYVLLLASKPGEAVPVLRAAVDQDGSSTTSRANLADALARVAALPALSAPANVVAQPSQAPSAAVAAASAAEPAVSVATALTLPPLTAVPLSATPKALSADVAGPVLPLTPTRVTAAATRPVDLAVPLSMQVGYAPTVAAIERVAPEAALVSAVAPSVLAPAAELRPAMAVKPGAAMAVPASLPARVESTLEISNGNGVPGMATRVGRWLATRGVPTARVSNQPTFSQPQTVVQYRNGHEAAAMRIARELPAGARTAAHAQADLRSDVRVVLGRDWIRTAACLNQNSCQPAATTVASLDER